MSSASAAARHPARPQPDYPRAQPGSARVQLSSAGWQPGTARTRPGEFPQPDHDRIERLFGALDDIGRYLPDLPGTAAGQLSQAWARISDLLLAHADAEELRAGGLPGQDPPGTQARWPTAGLDRIRAAVALAAGHRPGSAGWWRAVHAARLAARHTRLAHRG